MIGSTLPAPPVVPEIPALGARPEDSGAPIVWLAATSSETPWRIGNKAWRLGRLARAGLPVPAGFCIAADAFGDGGAGGPARHPKQPLAAEAGALPAALVKAILAAYRQLGSPLVAVRSSAADEDLAEQSGAGVYTSILNVRGETALLAAVAGCRAARPLGHGRRQPPAPLAVLVQRQIEAEASGVLFTADPLCGRTDRLVVNVVHGLGEPLAAGRVCGDTFHLTPDGELISQNIRRKETMLTRDGEQAVPPGRRQRPTLTAPELRRLSSLAGAVGEHFAEGPATPGIDIEFAFLRGRPILLQARPIPSRLLAGAAASPAAAALEAYARQAAQDFSAQATRLRADGSIRGADIVWSAGNIRELLPLPSRFSFALFRDIFAGRRGAIVQGRRRLGYRLGPQAGDNLFALIAGQPYFNLEIDAATYDVGVAPPIERLLEAVKARPELANYPELGLYPETLAATPGGAAAAAEFHRRLVDLARSQRRRFAALLGWLGRQAPPPAAAGDVATLQAAIGSELRLLRQLGMRFVIAARFGFYFADLTRRRLRALSANQAAGQRRYARLLQGLPGSLITDQTHDLEALADGRIERAAFLARHGHWASNELELSLPRLAEQPARIDAMLAELRTGGRSPHREFARQQAQRQRCEKALRRHLASRPGEAAELFGELTQAQHYLPLRESLKYHLAVRYARLRSLLQALARALDWPADSLFHLEPQEVIDLPDDSTGRQACLALSERRRQERSLARRLAQQRPLPTVLFASRPEAVGALCPAPADTASEHSGVMSGEPIAPGHAEGVVRLVRLDEESLADESDCLREWAGNEILVAPSANLGLAPLFRSAAGVIVEVGGVLAHCACQAREAGIPALVLADATRLLHDGDRVRIDAEHGRVIVLARARAASPEWH